MPRPGATIRICLPPESRRARACSRSCSDRLRWLERHSWIWSSSARPARDGSKRAAKSLDRVIEGAGEVGERPLRPRTAPYWSRRGRRISSRIGSRVLSAYHGVCGSALRARTAETDRRPAFAAACHSTRNAWSASSAKASSLIQETMDGRMQRAPSSSGSPIAPTKTATRTVRAAISRTRSPRAATPAGKISARRPRSR